MAAAAAGAASAPSLAGGTAPTRPVPVRDTPLVAVILVSFHHRNGPEVEFCFPEELLSKVWR